MASANPNVPAAVASGIICLVLGAGAGYLGNEIYRNRKPADGSTDAPKPMLAADAANRPPGAGGMGGPPMGGPGGMGGRPAGGPGGAPGGPGGGPGGMMAGMGGMGRGMQGPPVRSQLANLVSKLDVLTNKEKPLLIQLTPEQKQKVKEQLQGLADLQEVSDDEAKKRLDALLEVLKENKETLEAAGFRWPGAQAGPGGFGAPGGGRPGGNQPTNPFKDDPNVSKALKSLESTLGKGS